MKRKPLLPLIAAAALVLFQGMNPVLAENAPAVPVDAPASAAPAAQPGPVHVAWDRVGAAA